MDKQRLIRVAIRAAKMIGECGLFDIAFLTISLLAKKIEKTIKNWGGKK